jgi:Rod binding domain-containing protein
MSSAIQSASDLAITQAMGPSLANRLARKGASQNIDQASKDFEGMFMAQMLQPMFDTVSVDPIFGGGHGEEAMRGFLVQEYGKALSKSSHFGIADAVRAEMMRAQQKSGAAKPAPFTANNNGAMNASGPIQ